MTHAIRSRGPDADGHWLEGPVGLGHRRLSILDLTTAANQPMTSQCGRYVISYNGEVYNFQEIAKELPISVRTRSDTEVILEAFAAWGENCVHRFNGMFAIAIYDRHTQTLHLYRDRLGIKPIYYYWDGQDFVFSSELKAILALPSIGQNLTVCPRAIYHFLNLGYIPYPDSFFEKIKKLDAGTHCRIQRGEIEFHRYWDVESKVLPHKISLPYQDAKNELKKLLVSSVQYRMISDVPFGTFLSGGIDSSVVTAIAQSLSNTPIKTFSIAFQESGYDESSHARSVAQYLKTDHHELTITSNDAMDLIPGLLDVYDEPFSNSSSLPTLLLAMLSRKHVTMTLSGDGGDELFLGYGMYRWASRLSHPLCWSFRKPASILLKKLGPRYERGSGYFDVRSAAEVRSHIFSQQQGSFLRNELEDLLTPSIGRPPAIDLIPSNHTEPLDPMDAQALFDMKYYLKDELLVKVDRATMHHSLEARVPLLDYRVVEFALNLPQEFKFKSGVSKRILRDILFEYIPAQYFDRPKWGFPSPIGQWLKGSLRPLIDEYLSEEALRHSGILRPKEAIRIRDAFLGGKDYLEIRVWLMILLQQAMKKYPFPIGTSRA